MSFRDEDTPLTFGKVRDWPVVWEARPMALEEGSVVEAGAKRDAVPKLALESFECLSKIPDKCLKYINSFVDY